MRKVLERLWSYYKNLIRVYSKLEEKLNLHNKNKKIETLLKELVVSVKLIDYTLERCKCVENVYRTGIQKNLGSTRRAALFTKSQSDKRPPQDHSSASNKAPTRLGCRFKADQMALNFVLQRILSR